MNRQQLDEMAACCERAAPGPWVLYVEGRDHESGSNFIRTAGLNGEGLELSGASVADQGFIAHARQDLPALIAEVRRLRRLLGQ
ncbi:hypothetical protein M1B34_11480 [Pseudomonas sp. MAFF 302030]|uniref:Uncharacterized protein n=1 Tax=Pseudomonas morbosilactucae TaxID=2938197 RepID=A0A9X1YV98_9PSED|nr:hypothetical protein [Pseudomonas morbosilactucae]MCK9798329.1 hypothetical protein [Pseudomonas morbosilactucae]